MLSLAERVDRTILRYSLLPPGARVMVALSGGADSTALACLLVDLAPRRRFTVVAAAHYNHRLRAAAAEDEAFCRLLAGQLGLPFLVASDDVRAMARAERASIEDASRRLRYAFLRRAAAETDATHVAAGHTRDDQAETVLLQLARGTGLRGLGGMAPARPLADGGRGPETDVAQSSSFAIQLVRPLLEVGHQELVDWLGSRGQPFREDESNADPRFLRNRVRHEIIPFLRERLSPAIVAVLARNAEVAGADARWLDEMARAAYRRIAVNTGAPGSAAEAVDLDLGAFTAEAPPIRRRLAQIALRNLRPDRFVGREQVERVLALADGRQVGRVSLPGVVATVERNALRMVRSAPSLRRARRELNFSGSVLSIPGEARIAGIVLSSFVRPWGHPDEVERLHGPGAGTVEAIVDAACVSGLSVRTRRPGDWFRPLGLGGRRKKLQDYFVDRKVPRDERDRVPLVVEAGGRIVWVAGHGIDDEFRVHEGTHDVVILRMRGDSF